MIPGTGSVRQQMHFEAVPLERLQPARSRRSKYVEVMNARETNGKAEATLALLDRRSGDISVVCFHRSISDESCNQSSLF